MLDLLTRDAEPDQLVALHHSAAREPGYAPWPEWVDPQLRHGYEELGLAQLWQHQAAAAQSAWDGNPTIIATGTGSGKSVGVWLPTISKLAAQHRASQEQLGNIRAAAHHPTALYLSPTKALAHDQYESLREVRGAGGLDWLQIATADGDSSFETKQWARSQAHIVLSNPDYLHFALLPNSRRWNKFLRGLQYVIIDECHTLHGLLGSHVSAVLRRLRRLCRAAGSDPVFLFASATVAQPAEHAARLLNLTAAEVVEVTEDHSPRGQLTLAMWQPPALDPVVPPARPGTADASGTASASSGPRQSVLAEAARVLTTLVEGDARCLAFTRSRRAAETVAAHTTQMLSAHASRHADKVRAYRAGYLAQDRRELEQQISSGQVRALAATSALELGVDISGLDSVVLAGWPGRTESFWQRVGRAGRAGSDGLAVFIARPDPLDTYLVHNPHVLFAKSSEATVFDPNNPYVLGAHLCAAAAEMPITEADLPDFGPQAPAVLDRLVAQGALRRRANGWYWTHSESASLLTDLRGSDASEVRIVDAHSQELIGTVSAQQADATVHPGAVYLHQGVSYLVEALDLRDGVALVSTGAHDYHTWANWDSDVTIREVLDERQFGPLAWNYGEVLVSSQVTGYLRRITATGEILDHNELTMPMRTLTTKSTWWTLPEDVLLGAGVPTEHLLGALHAAEHAAIGMLPLTAYCDRWDLGGLSTRLHADTGLPTVFVHDAHGGGAGFAERGYLKARQWLSATLAAVSSCECDSGCPGCIMSPKCGNGNEPLHKAGAVAALRAVLEHLP